MQDTIGICSIQFRTYSSSIVYFSVLKVPLGITVMRSIIIAIRMTVSMWSFILGFCSREMAKLLWDMVSSVFKVVSCVFFIPL